MTIYHICKFQAVCSFLLLWLGSGFQVYNIGWSFKVYYYYYSVVSSSSLIANLRTFDGFPPIWRQNLADKFFVTAGRFPPEEEVSRFHEIAWARIFSDRLSVYLESTCYLSLFDAILPVTSKEVVACFERVVSWLWLWRLTNFWGQLWTLRCCEYHCKGFHLLCLR